MSINYFDFLGHTTIERGSLEAIPHIQGFYLLFDAKGEFIYVGKGFGDDRIKSHFNKNNVTDYYSDARYWVWIPTYDENEAFAYEKAVYDVHCQITGCAPKHNDISPPGIPSPTDLFRIEAIKGEYRAREDWINFLTTVINLMHGDMEIV